MFRKYIKKISVVAFIFLLFLAAIGRSYAIEKVDVRLIISEMKKIEETYKKDLLNFQEEYCKRGPKRIAKYRFGRKLKREPRSKCELTKDDDYIGLDFESVDGYIKDMNFVLGCIEKVISCLNKLINADDEIFDRQFKTWRIGGFYKYIVFSIVCASCIDSKHCEYVCCECFPDLPVSMRVDKDLNGKYKNAHREICFGVLENGKAWYLLSTGDDWKWENAFFACF